MTIEKISSLIEGKILTGDHCKEINRFYAGDFLSHVLRSAPPGCAWLTIMGNINVAGVAVMTDIGAVIICEDIEPSKELVSKAAEEGISIIVSPLSIFDCAAKIACSM